MIITRKIAASAVCIAAVLGATTLAQAQTRPASAAPASASQPVGAAEVFARWDKDHNKTLSPEEFKAGWDEVQANLLVYKLHENFVAMDTNKDGTVTKAEADQALAQFQSMRGGDNGGRGGGRMQRMIDEAFAGAPSLTLQQFEAQALARFDAADLNHDGVVTAAERQQARGQQSAPAPQATPTAPQ